MSWHFVHSICLVLKSSTESEYRAMTITLIELIQLQLLFADLHVVYVAPLLLVDSVNAQDLTKNPVFHAMIKHNKMDHHSIQDRFIQVQLVIYYVPLLIRWKIPFSSPCVSNVSLTYGM